MGDHRASIVVEFEMHGVKRNLDMWINWCPGELGCDQRVINFFHRSAEEAYSAWDEMIRRSQEEENKRIEKMREILEEKEEKEEYIRLKKKYEGIKK